MSALRSASERLRHGDLPQIGLLALAVVAAALVVAWPARPGLAHEAWYAVSQTRSVVVALLALGYGVGLPLETPRRALGTFVGVLVIAVSALPIETVAHAASAPATPAWWAWVATPAAVAGHLAFGMALGAGARLLRLASLTVVLVPAALAGAVALDVRLGVTLLNPLTAALAVAPWYLVAQVIAATVGALWWAWRARRAR